MRLRWDARVDALLHALHLASWGPGRWFCDWFERRLQGDDLTGKEGL